MRSSPLVRDSRLDRQPVRTRTARPGGLPESERSSRVAAAIQRTRQWLLDRQNPDGHWVGELEGDTILESEYLLLLAYLGRLDSSLARKAAHYLLKKQLSSGGWNIYPGGRLEVSASVKAYFALKLMGYDPESPAMRRARTAIRAAGGADAVNSFTRFYLALLGQISYEQCPAVPPEMVLLPRWFPVNLYRMSAWSRTILVPLSLMWAHRPVATIDEARGIRELFLRAPQEWPPLRCPGQQAPGRLMSWERFFRAVDWGLKALERRGCTPLRRRAVRAAADWMIERFSGSEGLGAIFPPMIWSVIALKCLGYDDDAPEVTQCHRQLDGLILEDEDSVRLQPCKSPVWDTAIAVRALAASGDGEHDSTTAQAVDWLLKHEIRRRGDWTLSVDAEPGGWCFEYANDFYPDVDDTAMVLMALASQVNETQNTRPPEARAAAVDAGRRARAWVLAMQNRDGGWGAFDRDNDRQFLCQVPFADHNAMIDPSTPDLTGRVLEALAQTGSRLGEPAVDRAVAYMRRSQQEDGSWFGRWGVNYVYGTWQSLVGLAEIGLAHDDPMIVAGAEWLLSCQQAGGGWGESPDSYAHPHLRGQGPVTASQTAWALLGLIAAGRADHSAVRRGIDYLIETQQEDGAWQETQFTGTGFPQVFYLRYHLYPMYFPLLALARWAGERAKAPVCR